MRVIFTCLAVAWLGFCVAADDRTNCEQKCEEKYENEDEKACSSGCERRGSLSSGGPLSFVNCHRYCDASFSNKTTEQSACHYACSLPMRSSVVMTLVNDNGKQRWKVVSQDGDDEPVVSMQDSSPLGDILLGKNRGNDLLALRAPDVSSEEEEEEDFSSSFMQMQQRMRQIMEDIHRQVLQDLQREQNQAVARPSGHNPWGSGRSVGNVGEDGLPMILTRPIESEEDGDKKGIVLEFRHRENRSRFLVLFHWLLVAVGIAALFTTILAICLFLRSIRNNNYKRMGRDAAPMPVFARVQPTSLLPVKKIPEDGWMDQPSGVPPPAYDQVSIHASPKMADSDKSTSEAETPSPTH